MARSATLLFAHGGGFCKDTWEPIVRRLRDSPLLQTVNTRCVSFDFKYHGSNRDESVAPQIDLDNPRGPRVHHPAADLTAWTSAEVLQQARALKSESVDTPLIGIGHSMGASAMWNTEAQHPGTFDGLILFEPVYGKLNSDVVTNFLVSITLQRESSWPSRAAAEEHLRSFKNFAAWDRESLDAYMKGGLVEDEATGNTVLACSTAIEASLYCHKLLSLSDQQLARPKCKVFFHYGSRTKMFLPPTFQELSTKWPHIYSVDEPIDNSSHAMVLEKPRESARNILHNLRELEPFCEQNEADIASGSRLYSVSHHEGGACVSRDQPLVEWDPRAVSVVTKSFAMTKTSAFSTENFLGTASSWLELLNQNTAAFEGDSMETSAGEQRSSEAATSKSPKRTNQRQRAPKKRRTTYDIRKQQRSDLVAEVANLENQLELLKHQLLLQEGDDNTTLRRTEAANSVLYESVQEQHVAIAGIQSMLVSQMQQNLSTFHPTHDFLRLSASRAERRATLEAIKKPKLRGAERFIRTWSREFNTRAAFSQENRFESVDGGFSVVRFDNAPLPCSSVKAAFDAIIYAMQNVDITISELFGSITIREDTDFSASDISQIRLVSTTSHGEKVESNSVVFSEFVDGPDECYGIVAADFVDADELYPYLPVERMRRDTTTIVLIQSSPSLDETQNTIVGTRWTLSHLVNSQHDISQEAQKELQEISLALGDTIKKCILQHLAE